MSCGGWYQYIGDINAEIKKILKCLGQSRFNNHVLRTTPVSWKLLYGIYTPTASYNKCLQYKYYYYYYYRYFIGNFNNLIAL